MRTAFVLIGDAWSLMRKQPALRPVALWLLVIPGVAFNAASRIIDGALTGNPTPYDSWFGDPRLIAVPAGLVAAASVVLLIWGTACVLVIGRRFLKSAVGRSRTSFRAVRREGLRFVIPLLLTGVLRACMTLLWSLLFVIPGIVYAVRTALYGAAVVCDKTPYRPGLRRCANLARGRTLRVLWTLLWLAAFAAVPAIFLSMALEQMLPAAWMPLQDAFDGALQGGLAVLLELAGAAYYADLKRAGMVKSV